MKYVLLLVFCFSSIILSKNIDSVVVANRINEYMKIDGILSEYVWKNGNCVDNFTQRDPEEGKPCTQKTEVRIGYDDQALYVGARLFDNNPDSIVARLGRKDDHIESDRFYFFIDPYNDKRSGYYFALNAGGTLYDGILFNDEWDDDSWDGVWEGRVNIDKKGWTAEMRIPFSQLRFQEQEEYEWGINFNRDISRNQEMSFLVFTPKDGSGFVSRFPKLVGVKGIKPGKSIEFLPYFRTKAEYLNTKPGDPFNDGSRYLPDIGADFKYAISSNLTLDATINPDFGQVEVDPAVVNLSDVETFYQEKRPFFIEGASIFSFGHGGSRSNWGFNWGNPNFFYSRRIGNAPNGSLPDHNFRDIPEGTRILGAAKITGKIGDNWNIGTVHALTNREYGDFQLTKDSVIHKFETEVEPMTYFGLARAQKEFDEGRQGLGFISTFSNRFFKRKDFEDEYNNNATTFGIDGWTFLDQEKMWVTTGWLGLSHVRGNQQRIYELQSSSMHYLQRPDRKNYKIDPDATSLTGFAGRLTVNKQKGNVIFNSAIGFIDPRFDVNDAGFMWPGDKINSHIGGGYKWTKTTSFTRYAEVIGALFGTTDFDYNVTWTGVWSGIFARFLNYYSLNLRMAYNPETINNRRTRGGPLTLNPAGWEMNYWLESDNRKHWVFGLGSSFYHVNSDDSYKEFEFMVKWKPTSNISLNVSPSISFEKEFSQWIPKYKFTQNNPVLDEYAINTFGNRYIFGELDYKEFKASIRLNWTFTPQLSFQLYAQPLISTGDYKNYKELAKSRSYDFNTFGENNSTIDYNDGTYTVDPDGNGPAESFSFDNPDFNYKSIRANAVLRWEYLPGSTLYFVWTQSRTDEHLDNGQFGMSKAFDRLLDANSDNIFMIKATYWMNL